MNTKLLKTARRIGIIVFILFLWLPNIERFFDIVGPGILHGIVNDAERPALTLDGWLSGHMQDDTEAWFDQYFGFRSYLIKSENQLNFSLFKDISTQAKTKIVLGKNNYLYEKGYIDNFNKRDTLDETKVEAEAKKIKKLQDKLEERDVKFLLVLSPTKTSVYPEFIPDKYIDQTKLDEKNNYEKIIPFLKEYGVNMIDAHEYFVSRKDSSPYTFFTRGGTHWNYYGSCLITREIEKNLEEAGIKNLANINCDPPTVDNTSFGTDRDLANLINVWSEDVVSGSTPHPSLIIDKGEFYKPNLLFVGDSFSWTLFEIMEHFKFYKNRDFYYYYSSRYNYPNGGIEPIDKDNLDWDKEVMTKDAVIIEATHTAIGDIGFGFIDDFLLYLEKSDRT